MPADRVDRPFLVFAGVLVVAAGVLVAVALLLVTGRGSTPTERRPLYIGAAQDLRKKIDEGGPLYFANPFAGAGFWLDEEGGRLVALSIIRPGTRDCTVKWKDPRKAYVDCDGVALDSEALDRFELRVVRRGERTGGVLVDLRRRIPAPASAAATT